MTDEATAKKRYFIITGTRLLGAVLIVLAIMTLRDVTGWSAIFGYALLFFGVIDMLVVPQILVHKWRSPIE